MGFCYTGNLTTTQLQTDLPAAKCEHFIDFSCQMHRRKKTFFLEGGGGVGGMRNVYWNTKIELNHCITAFCVTLDSENQKTNVKKCRAV